MLAFQAVSQELSIRLRPNFENKPRQKVPFTKRIRFQFHEVRDVSGFRSAGHI